MIIGAYPSARFERRPSRRRPKTYRTIPIADNLQPFGYEQYFDGVAVRTLTSADGIKEYLFSKLEKATFTSSWITDLVKVFLFKAEHVEACKDVNPSSAVLETRHRFDEFGRKSITWIHEECRLCRPKLILTLGEEVARILSGDTISSADSLLSPEVCTPESLGGNSTLFLPHPDACRRSDKWRKRMESTIPTINKLLHST